MPKVSVIIPVYGVEKYIERCARSLFEQTLDDIEYLFIDDCTPDKSIEVLKKVLEEYPNRKEQVVIHRMEKNSGQAAVRKWGMQNATGEYVIHCDSDDWVDNDMYRSLYEKGVNEDADLVICHYYNATSHEKKTPRLGFTTPTYDKFMWDMLYARVPWALWNKLFKRNCLKSIVEYPLHNMGEDMAIVFQIMTKLSKISVVNSPFYNYWINPLSITNDITDVKNASKIMSIFYDMISNENIVSKAWAKKPSYKNFQKGFYYLKINVKYLIKPLIGEEKYYIIWKQTYPGIDSKILCDCHISWRIRLRSLFSVMNIYHICVKIKNRFS